MTLQATRAEHAPGHPGRADDSSRRYGVLLAGALLALLLVRLALLSLNRTDLFFDEAQYWSWGLEPAFGYYSKPPLIAWIIAASRQVCGDGEFCVRVPSALMHTATAAIVYLLARRLYGREVGFWSGLAFATLPGVSLSAGIISTDVPLLLAWAVALLALAEMFATAAWWPAIVLALAIGVGLNAKYAMAYFVLGLAIYLATTPSRRWISRDARLWVALAIGLALIAPNMVWNASNSFATFAHTADNARWGGPLLHPGKALEFFAAQFGVFGPILFATLLVITVRAWRDGLDESGRLLLAFSLPILVIVTAQALISRAHANWAATAYVAATPLVIAALVGASPRSWLKASMWVHMAVLVVLGIGTSLAGQISVRGVGEPFARTLGWRELADHTRRALDDARKAGKPYAAIIADDRSVTAELLYYMRDEPTPVLAWRLANQKPQDHYELTRPYAGHPREPVLLVSVRASADDVTRHFKTVTALGSTDLPAGSASRKVALYALSGFDPQPVAAKRKDKP